MQESYEHVPIVAFIDFGTQADQETSRAAGMDDAISIVTPIDDLGNLVTQLITASWRKSGNSAIHSTSKKAS